MVQRETEQHYSRDSSAAPEDSTVEYTLLAEPHQSSTTMVQPKTEQNYSRGSSAAPKDS
jgi:hypothetical protein